MIAAWLVAVARAGVVLETPPVQGVETVVALTDDEAQPDAGETVRVIHRPGLAGEKELAIGITDGRGRVRWTPDHAGVAHVRAGDEVLDVSITPASPPTGVPALVLVLGAGALGALGFGLGGRRR